MQARFLLGAAGSGKTSQCLEEVRSALAASPEGPPLIVVAPKQATFQIERQLLADDRLQGFTRLFIVSFERLANLVIDALEIPPPRLLSEQGRLMVLRALLTQQERAGQLQLFRASARLPGFAQDLSKVIRECQHARIGPAELRHTAEAVAKTDGSTALARKLADIALVFDGYNDWLRTQQLADADHLLQTATTALNEKRRIAPPGALLFEGLWLDGFAEMTEQELALLAAVVPWCGQATLAFCCERQHVEPTSELPSSSHWSIIAQTARRCLSALGQVTTVQVIPLGRDPQRNRFANNPALAHLEETWGTPQPAGDTLPGSALQVVRCSTPEDEVTFAAREICRHVGNGGRYRDAAVLVREMDGYQDIIRRVFARYRIPCFLDRRETVAHHPLAELTRYAVRTVARRWNQEEWLGVLKSGLVNADQHQLDWLENECLANGWDAETLRGEPPQEDLGDPRLGQLRERVSQPLRHFEETVFHGGSYAPNGAQLATALRRLWTDLGVEDQLATWTAEAPDKAVHTTVWQQMEQWLETVRLAFEHQAMPLREWLPIMEAGLAGLTVGVIPPLLDEVLVGSIDRSRNPDLRLAFVLGVNEGVFPALPSAPPLLTERDRKQVESRLWLGPGKPEQLAHERFYGYIAFTRSREKLVVTYAEADRQGRKLNASSLVTHLKRLFPGLRETPFSHADVDRDVVHTAELAVPVLRAMWARREDAPVLQLAWPPTMRDLVPPLLSPERKLSPEIVEALYPARFTTSVSRLEEFASCPYRFFVTVGLRARERVRFEVDARHTGTFQHEVLMAFHQELQRRKLRWRDILPSEARALVREIAQRRVQEFKGGVLVGTTRDRVESQNLITALEEFIETVIGWAGQYAFEPMAVELQFGDNTEAPLPAWEIQLTCGRTLAFGGTIDRVDALVDPHQRHADLVVMDYKSSARSVDTRLLNAGVQMQLFAYLSALRQLPRIRDLLGVESVAPAGVFYVTLRGTYEAASIRDEALADPESARRSAYKHRGRFVKELLSQFDSECQNRRSGDQFNFRLTNSGNCHGACKDPMSATDFSKLLDGVEERLRRMGDAIFSGDISINPYRHSSSTACDKCDYGSICRIDPAQHQFRSLAAEGAADDE